MLGVVHGNKISKICSNSCISLNSFGLLLENVACDCPIVEGAMTRFELEDAECMKCKLDEEIVTMREADEVANDLEKIALSSPGESDVADFPSELGIEPIILQDIIDEDVVRYSEHDLFISVNVITNGVLLKEGEGSGETNLLCMVFV